MDELELRRRCYAQPTDQDPAFRAWLDNNPAARDTARKAAQFDQRLSFAMRQPPIPEGLSGRILLNTAMQARKRRRRIFTSLAVAASIVLSAGLVLAPTQEPAAAVGDMALRHVYGEIAMLETANQVVSQTTLRGMFESMGGELQGTLEQVRFAYLCPTPHGRGLHMIADTEAGRVTVLYLPETAVEPAQVQFADARFVGQTMATNGAGTLNVIGENREAVSIMRERLNRQVHWRAAALALGSVGGNDLVAPAGLGPIHRFVGT